MFLVLKKKKIKLVSPNQWKNSTNYNRANDVAVCAHVATDYYNS